MYSNSRVLSANDSGKDADPLFRGRKRIRYSSADDNKTKMKKNSTMMDANRSPSPVNLKMVFSLILLICILGYVWRDAIYKLFQVIEDRMSTNHNFTIMMDKIRLTIRPYFRTMYEVHLKRFVPASLSHYSNVTILNFKKYTSEIQRILSLLSATYIRETVDSFRQDYGWKCDLWICCIATSTVYSLFFIAVRRRHVDNTYPSYRPSVDSPSSCNNSHGDMSRYVNECKLVEDEIVSETDSGSITMDNDDTSDSSLTATHPDENPTSHQETTHNMFYVERLLTEAEYESEADQLTRAKMRELYRSPEFRALVKHHGKNDAAFNWQKRRQNAEVGKQNR